MPYTMVGRRPANGGAVRKAAFWLAFAAFLSGCNGFSAEDAGYAGGRAGGTAGGAAPAQAQSELARAASPFVAAATPGSAGYKIGPLDVLDITVFKVPDLSKTVQVAEAGTINLPLVGDVAAAGKTPSALERELQARLNAGYLKSPQVSVFVKEYNSSRITLEGAVKKPGVYPMRGHDTLLQSIALAEGLDRETSSTNVVLFRLENGVRSAARYDLADIRAGRTADPPVQTGDVIVVEDSMYKAGFQVFTKLLPLGSPLSYAFLAGL